jgi:hypothetical protein
MPKLPKTVRLPSGEMVDVPTTYDAFFARSGSGSAGGKLTKARPAKEQKETKGGLMMGERKEGAMNREDSFEWDKDVF